jgi:hypothetical protein
MRPEWDFVVKLYCDDSSYKKFIRLAKTAKDKTHFPRILQRHENVIPNFERPPSWSKVNIIVMEKLEEVSVKEYNSIKNFFKAAESYFLSLKDFLNTPTDFWYKGEMLKNR